MDNREKVEPGITDKGDEFCWKNNMPGETSKVKMIGSEKKANKNTSNKIFGERATFFFHNCLTRKFHVVVVQDNGKEMYRKGCCSCKVVFLLLIRLLRLTLCFFKGPEFRKFLLTKLINAELAAYNSAKFTELRVSTNLL